MGVLYNDSTRIVLHQNGEQLTYLDKEYKETVCRKTDYPVELKKKVSLIEYFRKYMTEHLLPPLPGHRNYQVSNLTPRHFLVLRES